MTFAEVLRAARLTARKTPGQAARIAVMTQAEYDDLESGKAQPPSTVQLRALEIFFGCPDLLMMAAER